MCPKVHQNTLHESICHTVILINQYTNHHFISYYRGDCAVGYSILLTSGSLGVRILATIDLSRKNI